eukprot:TRINITY_DN1388_c0_g1_i1.p1 TRINITY_DN1388_c0_g1~~TRINITY_DN1388_c0_g1_i1.p1  ORF type:complete len:109 (-),score=18.31 TRINITY_DN1388_c0_g1_i1:206-532(-)
MTQSSALATVAKATFLGLGVMYGSMRLGNLKAGKRQEEEAARKKEIEDRVHHAVEDHSRKQDELKAPKITQVKTGISSVTEDDWLEKWFDLIEDDSFIDDDLFLTPPS